MRVFAGQEPGGVWVGWITPDYHQYDLHFDMNKVRNVTVTVGDDRGNIHDRCVIFTNQDSIVLTMPKSAVLKTMFKLKNVSNHDTPVCLAQYKTQ